MAEEKQTPAQQLFDLLNQDDKTFPDRFNAEQQQQVKRIFDTNKDILKSDEFAQRLIDGGYPDREPTRRVLSNLKYIGENNPDLCQGLNVKFDNGKPEDLANIAATKTYNVRHSEENKSLNVQGQAPKKEPGIRKISQADANYLYVGGVPTKDSDGNTLVVEGEGKPDNEKIADLTNQPADLNKNSKREKANNRFKDEDVVKYMYEEWFLAALSWGFNATEDFVLGAIDGAFDRLGSRYASTPKQPASQAQSPQQTLTSKINGFSKNCKEKRTNGQKRSEASIDSFKNTFRNLRECLADPTKDTGDWDKDFLEKLRKDPQKANQFINSAEPFVASNVKMLAGLHDRASALTEIDMVNDVMCNDRKWRKLKGISKNYQDDAILSQEHKTRTIERQNKLAEAVDVLTADARLRAEAEWQQAPKGSKDEYIQKAVTESTKQFFDRMDQALLVAKEQQNKDLKDGRLDIAGNAPNKNVGKNEKTVGTQIKEIDKMIDQTIAGQPIYQTGKKKQEQFTLADLGTLHQKLENDKAVVNVVLCGKENFLKAKFDKTQKLYQEAQKIIADRNSKTNQSPLNAIRNSMQKQL